MDNSDFFGFTQLKESTFISLLPDFFEEINEDFNTLEASHKVGNSLEVRHLAHKMKGTSASYSAKLIFTASKTIQDIADVDYSKVTDKMISNLKEVINASHHYAKIHFLDH